MKNKLIYLTFIFFLLPGVSWGFAGTAISLLDDLYRLSSFSSKISKKEFTNLVWKNPYKIKSFRGLPIHKKMEIHTYLAVQRGVIPLTKQTYYINKFNHIKNGDKLFLICLKHTSCNIEKYSEIIGKSSLHRQIVIKNPSLNLANINHVVGSINENLMNKYFQSTGWIKIKGEIGRNGIDGLFMKKNRNGQIIDVLVAESKYNKSGLQYTKNGQQMTTKWVLKKVDDLQKKYPNNQNYNSIRKFVVNDNYRALLWNLKIKDSNLIISLKKIHDKNGKIVINQIRGNEKMKINFDANRNINIDKPENEFHIKIVSWYKEEIKKY